MKPMNDLLKKMDNYEKIMSQWKSSIDELVAHPYVQTLMKDNKDITKDDIEKNYSDVKQWVTEWEGCEGCTGLSECNHMVKGYRLSLTKPHSRLLSSLVPCSYEYKRRIRLEQKKLIKSHYINDDILNADFSKADMDDKWRVEALEEAIRFANEFEIGTPRKGLFFYGRFGTGKSFLMGCIANKLAERNIPNTMVYVPDFIIELKQSIGNNDGSLMEKLDHIKKTPVLFLDDLGSETMSPWVRDEVLGVVLQYRAGNKMPTMITSNLGYEELEYHFAYTNKEGEDRLKARRIMERIIYYTIPIEIDGENRRIDF